ncbi:stage II sporulation protein R [Thermincola potens]|uniref:Stage II sporulation protein R n=1 Tax=Thermincola potens (strain JR) TaxID=635013 RepID=D5X988_THEPJ|nr:stage II sporulation protein R [Thermincola potens]ADG82992.1 stage II sporulation protein R [Thermincola potens JR]
MRSIKTQECNKAAKRTLLDCTKGYAAGWTPRKALAVAAFGVLMGGFFLGIAAAGGFNDTGELYVQAYNQNNLIRFHVIANSDSVRDQALKRRVRDVIVNYMTPKFEQAKNAAEARKISAQYLDEMQEIAQQEVYRWGAQYKVKALLGKFTFPAKTYGNITLPAGEYQAVRIVLGEGAGANWWCVLFPPLCFISGSKEMPAETLPGEMPGHKGDNITNTEKNKDKQEFETEVRVKFKILEILRNEFGKSSITAKNY